MLSVYAFTAALCVGQVDNFENDLYGSSEARHEAKREPSMTRRRIIVGISGASGIIYGVRTLEILRTIGIETHLVMTRSAQVTLAYELPIKVSDVKAIADIVHRVDDIGASISSGSFQTMGMIVAPCSIRSLSEIATGVTSSLLTRAADVVLKERRRLVLAVRETPLHLGHLRAMTQVTEMGAIVMPPVPAFYAQPATLDDVINHSVGRVLDLFDIENDVVRRWGDRWAGRRRKSACKSSGYLIKMPSSLACTPEAQRKCHRTRHPFEEQPEDLRLLGRVELSPSRVKKTALPT